MADINKVWLSGRAASQPLYTMLPPRTPLTTFDFHVNERFNNRTGHPCLKTNIIRIESLGRAAELARDKVREGGRYVIEGYIRSDDGLVRIRTFAIVKEESDESIVYAEGLKQALEILERSRDKAAAMEELKRLLNP
jgi:hypothetical protein